MTTKNSLMNDFPQFDENHPDFNTDAMPHPTFEEFHDALELLLHDGMDDPMPFYKGDKKGEGRFSGYVDCFKEIVELKEENDELKKENELHYAKNVELNEEIKKEFNENSLTIRWRKDKKIKEELRKEIEELKEEVAKQECFVKSWRSIGEMEKGVAERASVAFASATDYIAELRGKVAPTYDAHIENYLKEEGIDMSLTELVDYYKKLKKYIKLPDGSFCRCCGNREGEEHLPYCFP